jgi:enamine deaminase RidA (YjgF/YER057c/UK114 family)
VWSFTPRITESDEDGLNRYMRMNIGRTAAYAGRVDPKAPPAGTGVGHVGRDLVVHAIRLAGEQRSIENPRQRPAWQYSARFGPCSPPFARATAVGHRVLASGTAAVFGESSMHPGDAHAQWIETMDNLRALATAAGLPGAWSSMTAYVSADHALDRLVATLPAGALAAMERIIIAPLCREELLVEIEGEWHG